ncbi:MAG: hypothetical protein FWE69_04140 [Clostridiales bacterium]|nr:hypothetical protein [Clostridiales bacterium]
MKTTRRFLALVMALALTLTLLPAAGLAEADVEFQADVTISDGGILDFGGGATVEILEGVTLTNYGQIIGIGTIINNGTIINYGYIAPTITIIGGEVIHVLPTVESVMPTGTEVDVNTDAVVLTFNKVMDTGEGAFTCDGLTFGAPVWSDGDTVVTWPITSGKLASGTTYTLNISGFADPAGNVAAADSGYSFTTAKASPTLTLSVSPETGQTYPGNVTLTATLSDTYPDNEGKTITFTVDGETQTAVTDASGVAGYTLTNPNVDGYAFGASYAGDAYNNAASAADVEDYNVAKGAQTAPVFANTEDIGKTYEELSFGLPAVSGGESTGAYSYRSDNTDVIMLTVPGGATIVGAGEALIYVKRLGDSNYNDSPECVTPIKIIVGKAARGTAPNAPTLDSKTTNSITVAAVSGVEFTISTTDTAPADGWQADPTFDGLDEFTLYYIFARVAEDENHLASPASEPLAVRTALRPATMPGDANCNGVVNAADAAAILRWLVDLSPLSLQGIANAMLTGGEMPSAADAARILRWLVELESKLIYV